MGSQSSSFPLCEWLQLYWLPLQTLPTQARNLQKPHGTTRCQDETASYWSESRVLTVKLPCTLQQHSVNNTVKFQQPRSWRQTGRRMHTLGKQCTYTHQTRWAMLPAAHSIGVTGHTHYTVSQKTRHQTVAHNCIKYYPIFKKCLLADSVVNLQQIHV